MKEAEELLKYVELESSSNSDYCLGLLSIKDIVREGTDEFQEAYAKEVKYWHDYYKNYTTIVEKKETITHTIKYLKWR